MEIDVKTYQMDECAAFRFTNHPLGPLSNFSKFPLKVGDTTFPTSEALYQACKFPDHPDLQRRIAEAPSPREAKRIAGQNKEKVRSDWTKEDVSLHVMRWVLHLKLAQHEKAVCAAFEAAARKPIVEHSKWDGFFGAKPGTGANSRTLTGRNVLGRMWDRTLFMLEQDRKLTLSKVPPPGGPPTKIMGIEIQEWVAGQAVAPPAPEDYDGWFSGDGHSDAPPPPDDQYAGPPPNDAYGAPPLDEAYAGPPLDEADGAPPLDEADGAPPSVEALLAPPPDAEAHAGSLPDAAPAGPSAAGDALADPDESPVRELAELGRLLESPNSDFAQAHQRFSRLAQSFPTNSACYAGRAMSGVSAAAPAAPVDCLLDACRAMLLNPSQALHMQSVAARSRLLLRTGMHGLNASGQLMLSASEVHCYRGLESYVEGDFDKAVERLQASLAGSEPAYPSRLGEDRLAVCHAVLAHAHVCAGLALEGAALDALRRAQELASDGDAAIVAALAFEHGVPEDDADLELGGP